MLHGLEDPSKGLFDPTAGKIIDKWNRYIGPFQAMFQKYSTPELSRTLKGVLDFLEEFSKGHSAILKLGHDYQVSEDNLWTSGNLNDFSNTAKNAAKYLMQEDKDVFSEYLVNYQETHSSSSDPHSKLYQNLYEVSTKTWNALPIEYGD